jgi:hypothetical protein
MMNDLEIFPVLGELNAAFGGARPVVRADQALLFEPGRPLGPSLAAALGQKEAQLSSLLATFISAMPGALQESLRATLHYALTQEPRSLVNFAWAPAYDFELDIWEAVEPAPHPSGITILLKSRYPDHKQRFG